MDQTEKAYQKQDAVFIGSKRLLKKSKKVPSELDFPRSSIDFRRFSIVFP